MDAFVTRKKRKVMPDPDPWREEEDDEPTEVKLAILSSLHPALDQDSLLDILLAHDGSVSAASASLKPSALLPPRKLGGGVVGSQTSLRHYSATSPGRDGLPSVRPSSKRARLLSKKGTTLHLYDPADIAEHTPCTVIHNFLAPDESNSLLAELLEESKTYEKITFRLFDNVVSSPHTAAFYAGSLDEMNKQKNEYVYNGASLSDVRKITPQMNRVRPLVEEAVNREIQERIANRYPGGRKLKYQSPRRWSANAAFVNCYAGPQENVGWHTDRLTYLGPRPVIGSLSLGVAREFRVRRIVVPKEEEEGEAGGGHKQDPTLVSSEAGPDAAAADTDAADVAGQIAIHLPHNSLLVMHAEMQEEWKHSVAPAPAIDPHPLAGSTRINITYRDYRPEFHPSHTPRCRCGSPATLRVVTKKRENWGRHFWMCYGGSAPNRQPCTFFQWAEFDDDGNPVWPGDTGVRGPQRDRK